MKWEESEEIRIHPDLASLIAHQHVEPNSLYCWQEGWIAGPFGIITAFGGYTIVHLASGLRAPQARYGSLSAAKMAAERFLTVDVDWYAERPFAGKTADAVAEYRSLT